MSFQEQVIQAAAKELEDTADHEVLGQVVEAMEHQHNELTDPLERKVLGIMLNRMRRIRDRLRRLDEEGPSLGPR